MKRIRDRIHSWWPRIEFDLLMLFLLFLLIFFFFWQNIVITIYPGERGVLFNRFTGTVEERVYTEGLQLIFPWDKMYVYDVRLHERTLTVPVLSQTGLTLQVTTTVLFKPDLERLPLLHARVGTDYETKVLVPVVMSSVREIAGAASEREIYTSHQEQLQNEILQEAVREGAGTFIEFDDIMIRKIELPPLINESIDRKIAAEQEMLRYDYLIAVAKKEAARKKIEAGGIQSYQEIINSSITPEILTWRGIAATEEIAKSQNSKVVVIGAGKNGLPVILGSEK